MWRHAAFLCLLLFSAGCDLSLTDWSMPFGSTPCWTCYTPDNSSIEVTPAALVIAVGDSARLTARTGGAEDGSFTWRSQDPAIVSVDGEGFVTARAPGAAFIYVSRAGRQQNVAVTVTGSAAPGLELTLSKVVVGNGQACGLTTSGVAYCWGSNGEGKLGHGGPEGTIRSTPVPVAGRHTFRDLAAGFTHTCGLTQEGEALCWGGNHDGQLGDGTRTASAVPVRVAGGLRFESLSLGGDHTCGLTAQGAAYCWGSNVGGQFGNGTVTPGSTVPVLAAGGRSFTQITAGGAVCGLTTDGAALCWGYNSSGQLGNGTLPPAGIETQQYRSVPTAVVGGHQFIRIAAGPMGSCAITREGAAYCWGSAALLGVGASQPSGSPVRVATEAQLGEIVVGQYFACGLSANGQRHCWGANHDGQLGDGTREFAPTPTVPAGTLRFRSVAAAENSSCGLADDGFGYCWGSNTGGQLGIGSAISWSGAPVPVAGQAGS